MSVVHFKFEQPCDVCALSRWERVAAWDVNVIDMDVLDGGYIYGVKDDHSVCLFRGGSACVTVAPPDVNAISVTSDGYVYGVSPWDQAVYVHSSNLFAASQ